MSEEKIPLHRTSWEPTTITLFDVTGGVMAEQDARQTIYEYTDVHGSVVFPATAFITEKQRAIWIGPQSDFYLELEFGVVGGKLVESGGIRWCESLVSKLSPKPTDLDETIDSSDQIADFRIMRQAQSGQIADHGRSHTDLRKLFPGTGPTGSVFQRDSVANRPSNITKVESSEGRLKLTLEIPEIDFVGEVWIDPQTREVTRSVQLSPAGTDQ